MTDPPRHRRGGTDRSNTPSGMAIHPAPRAKRRDRRGLVGLGTAGTVAVSVLAVLMLAASASAAAAGPATTFKAPYPGTATHAQSGSVAGCGSATHPKPAHFALSTGIATMVEKAAATTCTTTNGTASAATATGTAGLEFSILWNQTSVNGSAVRVVSSWTISWISSDKITGNGSLYYGIEQTIVGATFSLRDLTTNQTVGTASWSHSTTFNITRGSTSLNGSAVVHLAFHAMLVTGDVYVISTTVSGTAVSEVHGAGARTATVTIFLATDGAKAILQEISL